MTEVPSPTAARQSNESIWAFLERSTEPGDVALRTRYKRWLTRCPTSDLAELETRFRSSDDRQVRSAITELFVFELMAQLGLAPQVRSHAVGGSKPDMTITVKGASYDIEVHRSSASDRAFGAEREAARIRSALDSVPSPDFFLSVELELSGGAPRLRSLKTAVADWLASLDWAVERRAADEAREAVFRRAEQPAHDWDLAERYEPPEKMWKGAGWSLTLTANANAPDDRGSSPTVGLWNVQDLLMDSWRDIKNMVRKKVRQHPTSTDLIVVLDMSDSWGDALGFDRALYGPVTYFADEELQRTERERRDCVWPSASSEVPTAVLSIDRLGMGSEQDAQLRLWLAPSTDCALPGPWSISRLGDDMLVTTRPAATELAGLIT